MILSKKTYDLLKRIVQVVMPAFIALYLAVGDLWNLHDVEKVAGTLAAITAFAGVALGISTSNFNKSEAKFDGVFAIEPTDEGTSRLRLTSVDYTALEEKDELVFKLNRT